MMSHINVDGNDVSIDDLAKLIKKLSDIMEVLLMIKVNPMDHLENLWIVL